MVYKIASKVHTNRLKIILPEVIFAKQSAFVPGRLITDNMISAYECLHFLKRKKNKNNRHVAIKLDMIKAYDRVKWVYLRAVMQKIGISPRFIDYVMR